MKNTLFGAYLAVVVVLFVGIAATIAITLATRTLATPYEARAIPSDVIETAVGGRRMYRVFPDDAGTVCYIFSDVGISCVK